MSNENLYKFIDAVVNSDNDNLHALLKPTIEEKARSIVKSFKSKKIQEFLGDNDPLQITQDDKVVVRGKLVGFITNNVDDFNSGPSFTTADKSFSKEFDDLESLVAFLRDKFNAHSE